MKKFMSGLVLGATLLGVAAWTTPAHAAPIVVAQVDSRTNQSRHEGSFDNTWEKPSNHDENRYGKVNWHRNPFKGRAPQHGYHWKNGKKVYY